MDESRETSNIPKEDLLSTAKFDLRAILSKISWENSDPENDNSELETFTCDKCKFNSTMKKNLITHQKMVHGPQFFICNKCTVRTKTKDALIYHKGRKHGGKLLFNSDSGDVIPSEEEVRHEEIKRMTIAMQSGMGPLPFEDRGKSVRIGKGAALFDTFG